MDFLNLQANDSENLEIIRSFTEIDVEQKPSNEQSKKNIPIQEN